MADETIISAKDSLNGAKATKAEKTPEAKKPTHPLYADMISDAIIALKESNGSSHQAILKYILANYKVGDEKKAAVRVDLAIKKMLAADTIISAKGSFKLAKATKAEKTPDTKKPTHPLYADMISAAIAALQEKSSDSTRKAILKYILANYKVGDEKKAAVRVDLAIKKMLTAETIISDKDSFKLAKTEKTLKAKKSSHPLYQDMISEAIAARQEKGRDSSHKAILRYILANFEVGDEKKAAVRVDLAIKKMLAAETIISDKDSFKLAKAEKTPKAKKPAHPLYPDMISAAVTALQEENSDSSLQAIVKYIVANNKVGDEKKAAVRVDLAIKKMVAAKTIIHEKGLFKPRKQPRSKFFA